MMHCPQRDPIEYIEGEKASVEAGIAYACRFVELAARERCGTIMAESVIKRVMAEVFP
jgi:hypothetical protein